VKRLGKHEQGDDGLDQHKGGEIIFQVETPSDAFAKINSKGGIQNINTIIQYDIN